MKGFSLVEAIVSVAIIGLISVIVMISYGGLKNSSALNRALQKVALDIRRAQNLASSASAQFGGSVFCGYGIHYDNSGVYFLFADKDTSGDPLCGLADKVFNSGEEVETISIDQPNIEFQNSFSDILFFPPDPVTFINGIFSPGLKEVITLCVREECGSSFKRINMWGNGRIDLE